MVQIKAKGANTTLAQRIVNCNDTVMTLAVAKWLMVTLKVQ